MNSKNEEQSSLRHASGELKKRNNDLKEHLGEAALEHAALLAEVKKLQAQVVHSPERVRREMHESQRALQQERRDGEAAEAAALVARTAAKAVVDACGKVQDATAAVGDILDLSNKCIEVGHSIKAREASIQANRKDAAEVTINPLSSSVSRFLSCFAPPKHALGILITPASDFLLPNFQTGRGGGDGAGPANVAARG